MQDDNVSFEHKTKSKNDPDETIMRRPSSPIHKVKSLIDESMKLPSQDAK